MSVKSSAEIPVSSRVSRTAACLAVSPGSRCPFGNDHRLPTRIIKTVSFRKTIAPAESVVRSSSLDTSRRTSPANSSRFSFVTVSTCTFGCVRIAFVSFVSAIFWTTPRIGVSPFSSSRIRAENRAAALSIRPTSSMRISGMFSASTSACTPARSKASGNFPIPRPQPFRIPTRFQSPIMGCSSPAGIR